MNTNTSTARSLKIGLAAIAIVWLTGPLTVPIVKMLKGQFSPEEILIIRSIFGCLAALTIGGRSIWSADRIVKIAGLIIGCSSLAFYRAIQTWDVNPVMMVLTFLPIVNIMFALAHGRKLSWIVVGSFFLLIYGVMRTLDPWSQPINVAGLLWALLCVLLGGIGFELWGKASPRTTISDICFWLAFPLLVISTLIVCIFQGPLHFEKYIEPRSAFLLISLGVVNGVVYMYATIAPFSRIGKMDTVVATVLLQGTTPCTIVGAYFLVDERLTGPQWAGVGIALVGAVILSGWLAYKPKDDVRAAAQAS